jgi:hypothetical protein
MVEPGMKTDKQRLIDLLSDFGVTPQLGEDGVNEVDAETVTLEAEKGGVVGYMGFVCVFSFNRNGKFDSVGVWE